MGKRRNWVIPATLVLILLASQVRADGASASQVQQIVNNSDQSWLGKFANGIFVNLLYALTAWLELGLYLAWLAVSWTVLKLYGGVGTFLVPIWDFSNGSGFFRAGENSAFAVVSVPPAAANLLTSMVPWLLGLCGLLMFALAALTIPKALREGREPFEAAGGMVIAAGLLLAFPLLYSAPIHVGNFLGREFYEASHERYVNTSAWLDSKSPPPAMEILLLGSAFPSDAADGNQNARPAATVVTAPGGAPTQVTATSQLSSAFDAVTRQMSAQGDASIAWGMAKETVMLDLETQASRFVQVILGFMAIVSLVGLLLLKGSQIVALVLNYYLGWIACALYVHPSTRGAFGAWLGIHLRLCLWGLVWAFLIFAMDIIVISSGGLQGMIPKPGAPAGVFQDVGVFLMPFILFAALYKFRNVSDFLDSWGASGRTAKETAAALHSAFDTGLETVNLDLADTMRMSGGHGAGADLVRDAGNSVAGRMGKVVAEGTRAASELPGVGSFAAASVGAVGWAAGAAAQVGTRLLGKGLDNVNHAYGVYKAEPYKWEDLKDKRPGFYVVDLTKGERPRNPPAD
jgi:hypothetical protein